MNQLTLFQELDLAREAARHLIRVYVQRGDSFDSLKDMGASSPNSYWVTISGYLQGKHYGNKFILVQRDMAGVEVNKILKLIDIYNEVKGEVE